MPSATWSAHSEHARDKLELYQVLSDLDPPYGGKWHARASVGVVDMWACRMRLSQMLGRARVTSPEGTPAPLILESNIP
jgi:hypothetical protein